LNNALDKNGIQALIKKIQDSNYIYLSQRFLLDPIKDIASPFKIIEFIFVPWNNNVEAAIQCITQITEFLKNKIEDQDKSQVNLDYEALFAIYKFINRIAEWKKDYAGFDSVKTLNRIFIQLLKQQTLSFYGEPLTGLQIMGILETRNLDFKNLILLSVNENVIPSAKAHNSFIPFDIAKMAGLPTYKERDAVFAYHFYRLLQRAENVWLIYNTEPDEFGKGEQSRYITQIEEELKSPNITFNKSFYIPQLPKHEEFEIIIEKTKEIIDKIINSRKKDDGLARFSPTALSVYNACSLKYYFQYIEKIYSESEREDEIGMDIVGDAIHGALQDVFTPYLNKIIEIKDIDAMLSEIKAKILQNFERLVDKEELSNGQNHLTWKAAEKMAENYLLAEKKIITELKENNQYLELLGLEEKYNFPIEVNINNTKQTVLLEGKVDRIDRENGVLRISDYKTGNFDSKEIKLNDVFDIWGDANKAKALQLSHYILIAREKYPDAEVKAGIIPLRKPSDGFQALNIDKKETFTIEDSENIILLFKQLIEHLLNEEFMFEKTNNTDTCSYCNFKEICQR
jgi:CRISPR/Cas system-associated exonuclease Cas4 (RecB family)